jgi:ABC-type nitrate/sulfonate/bicarbonate transport system substrate-binding protein
MKRLTWLLALVLAGLAMTVTVTACGSSDGEGSDAAGADASTTASTQSASASGDSGSEEKKKITIALPFEGSTYTPLYLAVDEGYFAEEGLEPEIVSLNGGANVVKGLVSGSVDIGLAGLPDVITGVEQKQPLKVFYSTFNEPLYAWYAKDPSIKSLADAKGKTIGVGSPGGSMDQAMRFAVEQAGLDPEKDVKWRSIGQNAAITAALRVGQVDIAGATAESRSPAEEAGGHLIGSQQDLMKQYANGASTATDDFLAQNSDTVEAYLRALVKGIDLALRDPAKAEAAAMKWAKIDEQSAKDAYELMISKSNADGKLPDEASMDVFWQIGAENGLGQPVPEDQWVDPKWIDTYPEWAEQG